MQKLTDLIDALVTEKTFSLEGVKAIEAVRARAEALQKDLEMMTGLHQAAVVARDAASELAQQNAETCQQWKAREDSIAAREEKMTALEKDAAVQTASANTFRECFGLVFRNATVSESTLKNVPLVQPSSGGYSNITTATESGSTTRTQT